MKIKIIMFCLECLVFGLIWVAAGKMLDLRVWGEDTDSAWMLFTYGVSLYFPAKFIPPLIRKFTEYFSSDKSRRNKF